MLSAKQEPAGNREEVPPLSPETGNPLASGRGGCQFLDEDSPHHAECRKKLTTLVQSRQAVIAQQNLLELAVVLTRKGVSLSETQFLVKGFVDSIPVIRPTQPSFDLFFRLLDTVSKRGVALFDLYLAATFISHRITSLYTYNEKDFRDIKGLEFWKTDP